MGTHRTVTRAGVILASATFLFAACSSSGGSAAPSEAAASEAAPSAAASEAASAPADPMADLLAAAKAEGKLTTIALPHDWCNYGESIETFKTKYGTRGQRARPERRLGRRDRGDQGQQGQPRRPGPGRHRRRPGLRPHVQGRGHPRAVQGRDLGHHPGRGQGRRRRLVRRLLRRPRRSRSTRPSCRTSRRTGPTCSSPNTRARSPSPATRGRPTRRSRRSTRQRSPTAARSTTPQPGLDFFKQLNDAGNFVPIIATAATVAAGETPITIRWTYNALANRDATAASGGPAIEVVVPTSGRFAGVYVQAHQRLCPAPERGQALDGVPLLRRRAEHLAEGLLPPDPLRGPRRS